MSTKVFVHEHTEVAAVPPPSQPPGPVEWTIVAGLVIFILGVLTTALKALFE